jgi:hypothetical protein
MTVHDMEKAWATYKGFTEMVKWAVATVAIVVAIVIALIAN